MNPNKSGFFTATLCTLSLCFMSLMSITVHADAFDDHSDGPEILYPEYTAQKVLFEFYFNDPDHINAALYWIRALINPLSQDPYGYTPEDLSIKVVLHGTELVTLAKHNEEKYQEAIDRMRYYADLGVEFRVCGLAAHDFGYQASDLQDFVKIVPSAMPDMVHWQMQGYGLIKPEILDKRFRMDEIR